MFIDVSSFLSIIISLVATIMALCIAAPFHEFAHAYAAKREGDYTAVATRRCTLAALPHFDIWGFISLFFFGFGWAKPVPVDSRNFKRGRKSEFIVSIAGILMNFVLGIVFLFIYMLLIKVASEFLMTTLYGNLLAQFLNISISLNFMLAFFNLLPIYPLDGYRIIDSFCRFDNKFLQVMRQYSTLIYILVLITGIYGFLYYNTMGLFVDWLIDIFSKLLGI